MNECSTLVMPSPNESSSNSTSTCEKAHTTDEQSPAPPEVRSVHVRFRPLEGRRLQRPEPTTCPDKGALWAERPILIKRANGTYELMGTSRNLEGLARWILSFGPGAEVRSPERLKRQVALQAWRVWAKYDGEGEQGDKQKEGGA